jgi:hypothetical protein
MIEVIATVIGAFALACLIIWAVSKCDTASDNVMKAPYSDEDIKRINLEAWQRRQDVLLKAISYGRIQDWTEEQLFSVISHVSVPDRLHIAAYNEIYRRINITE